VTETTINITRADWARALRSGEYEQGANYLKKQWPSGAKHCCLGVALELAGVDANGPFTKIDKSGVEVLYRINSICDLTSFEETLPVAQALGLTREMCSRLAELNDRGRSFNEIADIINGWGAGPVKVGNDTLATE
jgi:hypothetical protein